MLDLCICKLCEQVQSMLALCVCALDSLVSGTWSCKVLSPIPAMSQCESSYRRQFRQHLHVTLHFLHPFTPYLYDSRGNVQWSGAAIQPQSSCILKQKKPHPVYRIGFIIAAMVNFHCASNSRVNMTVKVNLLFLEAFHCSFFASPLHLLVHSVAPVLLRQEVVITAGLTIMLQQNGGRGCFSHVCAVWIKHLLISYKRQEFCCLF